MLSAGSCTGVAACSRPTPDNAIYELADTLRRSDYKFPARFTDTTRVNERLRLRSLYKQRDYLYDLVKVYAAK
jgi:hypothetical protein